MVRIPKELDADKLLEVLNLIVVELTATQDVLLEKGYLTMEELENKAEEIRKERK